MDRPGLPNSLHTAHVDDTSARQSHSLATHVRTHRYPNPTAPHLEISVILPEDHGHEDDDNEPENHKPTHTPSHSRSRWPMTRSRITATRITSITEVVSIVTETEIVTMDTPTSGTTASTSTEQHGQPKISTQRSQSQTTKTGPLSSVRSATSYTCSLTTSKPPTTKISTDYGTTLSTTSLTPSSLGLPILPPKNESETPLAPPAPPPPLLPTATSTYPLVPFLPTSTFTTSITTTTTATTTTTTTLPITSGPAVTNPQPSTPNPRFLHPVKFYIVLIIPLRVSNPSGRFIRLDNQHRCVFPLFSPDAGSCRTPRGRPARRAEKKRDRGGVPDELLLGVCTGRLGVRECCQIHR
ncbi:hypothetical protein QBC42DRAFT_295105 [Cladorrhinum samala]|uniref:Uncharacterized protein n=1 Tax=Cladorrhinum samala TaxID=585594 RepID=A0AAV9HZJ3_9PEZI|nr:hypothetical protein QBC42DRAFT_295105 [Cladorrhinum samala]